MKIVIAGATSFIGLELLKALAKESDTEVLAIARETSPKVKEILSIGNNVALQYLTLEDYDQLGTITGPIDCLIYLTWNGTRGESRSNHDLQVFNYEQGKKAVCSVMKAGCKKIITAGSQAEYGPWFLERKETEEDIPHPNTEYGRYKLKFFQDIVQLGSIYNTKVIEPRFFSLYGPRDYEGTMVISILKNMLKNKECNLTKAVQIWDFLYISDAISALMKLIKDDVPEGVYNFGSGESHPLRYYIDTMYQLTGSKSKLNYGAVPYPSTGIVNVNPDVTKLKNTGWRPKVSFKNGIANIINYMQVSLNNKD